MGLSVLMVSDFCYPGVGGVESHIFDLSATLVRRGHRVAILTHAYYPRRAGAPGAATPADRDDPRTVGDPTTGAPSAYEGVRYFRSGVRVYYAPFQCVPHTQVSFPTAFAFLPLLRSVLLREQVDVVHAHQSTSCLAHECMFHARSLGYRTVFTDHSLHSVTQPGIATIHMNKVISVGLTNADHAICVSGITRQNLALKAGYPEDKITRIPNAIDCQRFTPPEEASLGRGRDSDVDAVAGRARVGGATVVTFVLMNRLTYRKGVDLMAEVIPQMCARHGQSVRFLIGGDGEMRESLERAVKAYTGTSAAPRNDVNPNSTTAKTILQEKDTTAAEPCVSLLGTIDSAEVPEVLRCGDVFLNLSLTESFCIALVEAASCGLRIVSTNVGGIPETLPAHLMRLADPTADAMLTAMEAAYQEVAAEKKDHAGAEAAKKDVGGSSDGAEELEVVSGATGARASAAANNGDTSFPPPPSSQPDDAGEKGPSTTYSDVQQRQWRQHEEVRRIYSWEDVTTRTEEVYTKVLGSASQTVRERLLEIPQRLGFVSALIYAYMVTLDVVLVCLLRVLHPARLIQVAPALPVPT
eukprot:g9232.t1